MSLTDRRRALPFGFACFLVLVPIISFSQTQEIPTTPKQTSVATDAPLNPALPTVFIVGDSTARNQADLGWGDHFAHFFDTSRINVANRARAGRSSRSYYNEGLWDKVLSEMKAGDYVLIQMGHNDGGGDPSKDPKSRGSVKGIGDDTMDLPIKRPFETGPLAGRTTETVYTYGWYLRKYIEDARAKGAHPILLTVTVRNIWRPGPDGKQHIERDMGYRDYEYQVAAQEKVPVVDMATVEADRLEALGPEKTAALFPVDHTHTSPEGAEENAESVVIALKKAHSALAAYLRPSAP
ncbi:MAG TPA: rhamnogalacturonan acetylesterase [Edaphobacter sp.]|nr:rhamnogalacturonan acetylesterase [Edaphobacter sp.]